MDFSIDNSDFPVRYVSHFQRVYNSLMIWKILEVSQGWTPISSNLNVALQLLTQKKNRPLAMPRWETPEFEAPVLVGKSWSWQKWRNYSGYSGNAVTTSNKRRLNMIECHFTPTQPQLPIGNPKSDNTKQHFDIWSLSPSTRTPVFDRTLPGWDVNRQPWECESSQISPELCREPWLWDPGTIPGGSSVGYIPNY